MEKSEQVTQCRLLPNDFQTYLSCYLFALLWQCFHTFLFHSKDILIFRTKYAHVGGCAFLPVKRLSPDAFYIRKQLLKLWSAFHTFARFTLIRIFTDDTRPFLNLVAILSISDSYRLHN